MEENGGAGVQREVFGRAVRLLRTSKGLKQSELAERMAERGYPWHGSTVSKTENGDRDPSLAEMCALAEIFDRPADYFLRAPATRDWHRLEQLKLMRAQEREVAEAVSGYEARERSIEALIEANKRAQELIAQLRTSIAAHRLDLNLDDADGEDSPEQGEVTDAPDR